MACPQHHGCLLHAPTCPLSRYLCWTPWHLAHHSHLPTALTAEAIVETILRAAEVYGTPAYKAMRDRCIAQDLSWSQPAKKWEAVLTELKCVRGWGVCGVMLRSCAGRGG